MDQYQWTLTTRISTHHLVNMAHDYKLDPVLDDSTNHIDCCKELDVWVELTEPPEKKKTLAIFLSL